MGKIDFSKILFCIIYIMILGCNSVSTDVPLVETFTVKFNLNASDAKNAPEIQNIERGQTAKTPQPDPTRDNYAFGGWFQSDNPTNEALPYAFSLVKITKNITLYAKWTRKQLTITYLENKPSGVTESITGFPAKKEVTINSGDKLTPPPTNLDLSDYDFKGWYAGTVVGSDIILEASPLDFTLPVTADTKIYAKWSRTQVMVTYVENKPVGVTEAIVQFPSPLVHTIDRNTTIAKPTETPDLSDYGFVGWYGGTETGGVVALDTETYDFTTQITASTKIYAKWRRTQVTVTFVENKPVGVTEAVVRFPSPLVQTIDRSTTLSEPTETPGLSDYGFVGWYGGTETGGTVTLEDTAYDFTTPITADTKIYAKWSRTQVMVTYVENKPVGVTEAVARFPSPLVQTIDRSTRLSEPTETPGLSDYGFVGWYGGTETGGVVALDTETYDFTTPITADTKIYAKWNRTQITVTYVENKPVGVTEAVARFPSPLVQTIDRSTRLSEPTETPNLSDYGFVGWYGGTETGGVVALDTETYDFTTPITANTKIYAKWRRTQVTVTYVENKPAGVTEAVVQFPSPTMYTIDRSTTIAKPTETPGLSDYGFVGWYGGTETGGVVALDTETYDFTTQITASTKIYAKWRRTQVTVTFVENKPVGVTEAVARFPSPLVQTIDRSTRLSEPTETPGLSDYGFVGWYGGAETGGVVALDTETYDFTTQITASTKIYAKWRRTQVTVTFVENKPAGVTEAVARFPSPLVQTIDRSTTIAKPTETPGLSDYGFVGWYGGTETGGVVALDTETYDFTTPITANTKIYAKWRRTQVTVTYVENKPAGVTEAVVQFPSPTMYTIDRSTRLSEPTETPGLSDYGFVGWYGGAETGGVVALDTETYDFTTQITADTKIYAKWSRKQVTVTYVENKPVGVTEAVVQFPSPTMYTIDRSTRLSEPTETPGLSDYGFVGWYGGAETGGVVALDTETFNFTTPITANTMIYAKWSRTQVTVTYVANKPVGVAEAVVRFPSPLVQTIDRSTRLSEPTETPGLSDYGFVGWYGGTETGGAVALDTETFNFTTPITADTKIYAKWRRKQVTVTYVENKPAGVTEAVVRFPSPLVQTIGRSTRLSEPTETPGLSDYGFVGWYGGTETGGVVALDTETFNFTTPITANTMIYAKWRRSQVTVTYVENKPAGVTEAVARFPSPTMYTIDRSTRLSEPTETPDLSDYGFVGWYGGTETGGVVALDTETYNFTTPITADKKIFAKWRKNRFKVKFNLNGVLAIHVTNVPSEQTINDGNFAMEPNAMPTSRGYRFLGWFLVQTPALGAASFAFKSSAITQDMELFAKWEETGDWKEADVAVLIVMGQSNSYGDGQNIQDQAFTTPLENVYGLLKQTNPNSKTDDVIWSKLQSDRRFNLGETDNRNLAGVAFLMGKIWQDNKMALNLPDLYTITIGTGATPIFYSDDETANSHIGWSPELPDQLYNRMTVKIPLALKNLINAGKKPRVIGVHWNQWESDAIKGLNENGHDAAEQYQDNLERIITGITQVTNSQLIPIYLYKPTSKIPAFVGPSTVNGKTTFELITEAIDFHVSNRNNVNLIDPSSYGPDVFVNDNVHYNLQTQSQFAEFQFNKIEKDGEKDGEKGVEIKYSP